MGMRLWDRLKRLFGTEIGRATLSEQNLHAHECPRCRTVWRHDPDTIESGKRDAAHTCPVPGCGGMEFRWMHAGDAKPADQVPAAFCHNGTRTIAIPE